MTSRKETRLRYWWMQVRQCKMIHQNTKSAALQLVKLFRHFVQHYALWKPLSLHTTCYASTSVNDRQTCESDDRHPLIHFRRLIHSAVADMLLVASPPSSKALRQNGNSVATPPHDPPCCIQSTIRRTFSKGSCPPKWPTAYHMHSEIVFGAHLASLGDGSTINCPRLLSACT